MNAKILRPAVIALIRTLLLAGIGLSLTIPAHAQKSAAEALQKARVVERLSEGMAVEKKGEAPGFVLDPAWPQPLPNHWVIGDVGGIAVDKHNQIWVYHRPRSVIRGPTARSTAVAHRRRRSSCSTRPANC